MHATTPGHSVSRLPAPSATNAPSWNAVRHTRWSSTSRGSSSQPVCLSSKKRRPALWEQRCMSPMPQVPCSSAASADNLAFGPERSPGQQSSNSSSEDHDGGETSAQLRMPQQAAASQVGEFSSLSHREEPTVKLVTKLRVQPDPRDQAFWNSFMFKCRLAWDVFFPAKPQVLSPAGAVKSRLQMILVSDRCGLDLATLMQIKNSSLAALAGEHGWEDLTELEVQVASINPSGERMQISLPLSSLPSKNQLRDVAEYNYENPEEPDEIYDDVAQVSEPALASSP